VVLEIARPDDFDRLLDDAASDPEQNLPYWAELWPSGIALGAAILREPDQVRGKRVLELGCGLGVTAIAALKAGADLLATDYSPEALALCRMNVRSQAGAEPETLKVNWRKPSATFLEAAGAGFPVVLAADVVYEARDIEPLLELIERVLSPGGLLWLAEPGRRPAGQFVDTLRERGWSCQSDRIAGPWPDPEDNRKGVVVNVHRFSRGNGEFG
jgi:predicted nicotinamide N-methyase